MEQVKEQAHAAVRSAEPQAPPFVTASFSCHVHHEADIGR